MPTYNFIDKKTNRQWSETMTIDEMEKFLEENKDIDTMPASPMVIDKFMLGTLKTSDAFNEKMKAIKRANPGSKINTR